MNEVAWIVTSERLVDNVDINITKFYAVTATEFRHSSVILLSIRKNLCSRPRLSFIVIMTDIQNFCEKNLSFTIKIKMPPVTFLIDKLTSMSKNQKFQCGVRNMYTGCSRS
jgi:hypothetical protein